MNYNIQSWPTKVQSAKFTELLAYNAAVEGLSPGGYNPWQPLWSGRISASSFAAGTSASHGFVYKYDPSGRLSRSYYGEGAEIELDDADYTEGFQYDSMGNITRLERYGLLDDGTYNVVDYLTLTYDGNHLVKVSADETDSDPTFEGAMQFNDESDATVEYEYDENGNMTKDLNRRISSIQYNLLNLPSHITIKGDGMNTHIDNTYDASGNKLRTTVGRQMTIGPIRPSSLGGGAEPQGGGLSGGLPGGLVNPVPSSNIITTDYRGNAIYRGDTLSMLLTEEGYVTFTNDTTPVYHYYLKDHLGSVRVVFDQDGAVEQKNDYYPSGTLMYTSTNGTLQPYKFGGKELERSAGLDEYDFGARWMDPVIGGRFTTMDPMCEKYYGISPYAYCGGDPVNFVDPDGRDSVYFATDGLELYRHGQDISKTYIFVLKTYETTSEMYGNNNGTGNTNPISKKDYVETRDKILNGEIEGAHMKNVTSFMTMGAMKAAKKTIKDDGKGGGSKNNNREYSGDFTSNGIKNFSIGPVSDPTSGKPATSKGNPSFHSHPSGTKINQKGQLVGWAQPPSHQDIITVPKGKFEFVFGMEDGMIYKYDRSGVISKLPMYVIR